MEKLPTICLNMIVKNESLIIKRLLESVLPIIDSYCICDTGSTDNTIEIIESFFNTKKIQGKIVKEPFRDFSYNRSFAMNATADVSNSDYLLLLDADMIFSMNIDVLEFKKRILSHDAFNIFQGSPKFYYKNARIIRNRIGCSYFGVTHEYLKTPQGTSYATFNTDEIFINDIGDGGCKSDKCDRDIRLLTKGLEDTPNNDRYTFYLANSYRDKGNNEKAIELYKKRIELGGWIEEIWQSNYGIGKCLKRMGNNAMAIYYWLEAFNCYPNRIENLYEIIKYYRIQGNNELAYTFYMLADYERKKHSKWDYLFLQKDIYDYKLDYELSIIGYYCNKDNHDLANISMKLLASPCLDDKNVLSNYKFYTDSLSKYSIPMDPITKTNLSEIGGGMNISNEFVSSTPSVCFHNGKLVVCVRYVNYRIDDSGNYINQENINTKNIIARFDISSLPWKKIDEYEMTYDTTLDGRYVGSEDVRLFPMWKTTNAGTYEWLVYNANRGIGIDGNKMCIEHGIVIPTISNSVLLKYDQEREIEKNWILFGDGTKCIYSWNPLVIGEINGDTFKKTNEITNVPNFFKNVRGSTNGVKIGDEYWFISHIVSYEDRRYYYHIMIVLDENTLELKGYTPLFTFEKEPVEYTLGFVYFPDNNQFLIGYSVLDSQTKYIMVSKERFDDWMI